MNTLRGSFIRRSEWRSERGYLKQWLKSAFWIERCSTSETKAQRELPTKEEETDLAKHLKTKIKAHGLMTSIKNIETSDVDGWRTCECSALHESEAVAVDTPEISLQEALINPKFGFYMNGDVLGRRGDFVTSPEISQVFGEMGEPKQFKVVELGPGKGTLMADLLRGTQRALWIYHVMRKEILVVDISPFVSAMESVNLVEISSSLKKKQAEILKTAAGSIETSIGKAPQIFWHDDLEEIPKTCPEFIIGHEFLDALSVHQFIKTPHGWRERMVDIAEDDDPLQLRFVLAPSITPASAILPSRRLSWMSLHERDAVTELEVGSDMLALGIRLAQRISLLGGAALMIDYGQDSHYPWSLQGIRKHRHVHVLERPGETDVSAHVDFAALRHSVEDSQCNVIAHGPIEQRYLLKALGIDLRMEQLVQHATDAQFQELKSGYERLIGSEETGQSEGMGKLYKAMAITRRTAPFPVAFALHPN